MEIRRGIGLQVSTRTIRVDGAGRGDWNRVEAGGWTRAGLTCIAPSPAEDRAVGLENHIVIAPCCNGDDVRGIWRGLDLTKRIGSPSDDGAIGPKSQTVTMARLDIA